MAKEAKYKVGDRVVIKTQEHMRIQYGEDSNGIRTRDREGILVYYPIGMENAIRNTDRIVIIERVTPSGYYSRREGYVPANITDDMILGYAFKMGEEIEVCLSDNAYPNTHTRWQKKLFVNYTFDGGVLVADSKEEIKSSFIERQWFNIIRPVQAEKKKKEEEFKVILGLLAPCGIIGTCEIRELSKAKLLEIWEESRSSVRKG